MRASGSQPNHYKRFTCMKTLSTMLLATAFCLVCVSCKSKEEQAREQALENRADRLEDQAKATEKAGNNASKNVEKAAENQSDALKNEADKTRDLK